jgi:hypothetical protein
LVNIFDEGELRREATIRKFRIVRTEGKREVAALAAKVDSHLKKMGAAS